MDLESTYLVVGVLVISAAILLIIDYLFKNKSYEEVVAEQMQQTRALYASQQRPKVKDKKQKKVAKKVKEKKNSLSKESTTEEVTDGHETTESQSTDIIEPPKHHVEFKEPSTVEEPVKEVAINKKRVKKEAGRPILVHKETTLAETVQQNSEALPANHFEESHPMDDFELHSSHTVKEENSKEKKKNRQNGDHEPQKTKKAPKYQAPEPPIPKPVEPVEKQEQTIVPVEVPVVANGIPPIVPVKEKKKKKNDGGGFAMNASDKQGTTTLSDLIPLVRKAEMSRVEVQNLIDILLNKQQDAPVIEEWSEGKGDPVQKLKKQLADKEKQIAELQETVVGSQMKLKEVRTEQNSERSHLMQTVRELEEAIKMGKIERQSTEGRMQNITMKCQQLQEQCNEEALKARKILEEYTGLKMQTQQMEIHLSQAQEAEVTIAQLRTELQELQGRRTMENHAMEHNIIQVKQLQHQINTCKEDIEKKDCRLRELKDINSTLDSRLNLVLHEEDELKSENAQLKGELQRSMDEMRRLEHNKLQELQIVRSNKDEIEQEHSLLISDLQKLNAEVTSLKQENSSFDQDHTRLKEELSKLNELHTTLKKEHSSLREEAKKLQDAKVNGLIEDKQQVGQLQGELAAVKSQVQDLEEMHLKEVSDLKALHTKEVEEQRNKNNELRQKNWKVVEALNAAESRFKSLEKQSNVISSNTQTDELQTKAMFIQRLFSGQKELESLPQEKCEALLKKFIADYTSENSIEEKSDISGELSKLKVEVEDYKKIIDETDSLLSRLQTDIKETEIHWSKKLKDKDDEIDRLTEKLSLDKNTSNSLNTDDEDGEFQNYYTNGPETALNDLTFSTNSSAASSIVDLPLKKKKKNGK